MDKKVRVIEVDEKQKSKYINDCCEDRLYIKTCECSKNVGISATINATSVEMAIPTTEKLKWTSINTTNSEFIYRDPIDTSKICLKGAGRYRVGYYINFKHKEAANKEVRVNLIANDQVIFTYYTPNVPQDTQFTQTISAIIVVPVGGTCLQLQNANAFNIYHQLTAGDIQKIE